MVRDIGEVERMNIVDFIGFSLLMFYSLFLFFKYVFWRYEDTWLMKHLANAISKIFDIE